MTTCSFVTINSIISIYSSSTCSMHEKLKEVLPSKKTTLIVYRETFLTLASFKSRKSHDIYLHEMLLKQRFDNEEQKNVHDFEEKYLLSSYEYFCKVLSKNFWRSFGGFIVKMTFPQKNVFTPMNLYPLLYY